MARLLEFSVLGLVLLAVGVGIALAVQVSPWLGLLVFLVLILSLVYLIYNFDAWLVRRLTKSDPRLILSLCETGFVGRVRQLVGWVPSGPRCRFCHVPFSGFGTLLHIKPSSKNPNFCRSCFEALPERTFNMETGVLFADVRGFTAFSESHTDAEAREKLTQFYSVAEQILSEHEVVLEFVGDQVMALFLPVMPGLRDRIPEAMLGAARKLIWAIDQEADGLPVGLGLNVGDCEVGNLAKGGSKDFTAVGDVVNTAARLQTCAQEFEIVLSESVYAAVGDLASDANFESFELKGKAETVAAFVIPAPE
jgi:adenylate cyclase